MITINNEHKYMHACAFKMHSRSVNERMEINSRSTVTGKYNCDLITSDNIFYRITG